jgi:anti-sigma B factor antagonist
MNVEVERGEQWTVLRVLEERVDAHNSGELKSVLLELLEKNVTSLAVDLSQVRFIDSSGLGALLAGYKNANLRQARLLLVGVQPRVQSMFELTRLHHVFEMVNHLDEVSIQQ